MSILLTGSTGFIGRNLLKYHCDSLDVVCLSRGYSKVLEGGFYVQQDLTSSSSLTHLFQNLDCIIHLAGIAHNKYSSVEEIYSLNTSATLKFAREAANFGVNRFVFVSTALINLSPDFTIQHYHPQTKSKFDAETGLKKIAAETGMELVIVRPTLVYGPNAPGNFGSLVRFVSKLPCLPFGLTHNKRDFIAVQNLADLLVTCVNHPDAAGHTFLASDGKAVSIKEFTNAIAKGLNKKLLQLPVPLSLMYLGARLVRKHAMAEQLLGNLQVDSSNAQEVLGWVPPYTMEQAMASLSENKK